MEAPRPDRRRDLANRQTGRRSGGRRRRDRLPRPGRRERRQRRREDRGPGGSSRKSSGDVPSAAKAERAKPPSPAAEAPRRNRLREAGRGSTGRCRGCPECRRRAHEPSEDRRLRLPSDACSASITFARRDVKRPAKAAGSCGTMSCATNRNMRASTQATAREKRPQAGTAARLARSDARSDHRAERFTSQRSVRRRHPPGRRRCGRPRRKKSSR